MACRLAISRDRFCSAPAADPQTDQLRALQPQAHRASATRHHRCNQSCAVWSGTPVLLVSLGKLL